MDHTQHLLTRAMGESKSQHEVHSVNIFILQMRKQVGIRKIPKASQWESRLASELTILYNLLEHFCFLLCLHRAGHLHAGSPLGASALSVSRGLAVHGHISHQFHQVLSFSGEFCKYMVPGLISWRDHCGNRNYNTSVISNIHPSITENVSICCSDLLHSETLQALYSLDIKPSVGSVIYRKYNNLILDMHASCCEHLLFMAKNTEFSVCKIDIVFPK